MRKSNEMNIYKIRNQKKRRKNLWNHYVVWLLLYIFIQYGANRWIWTNNLLSTSQMLYQLRYVSIYGDLFLGRQFRRRKKMKRCFLKSTGVYSRTRTYTACQPLGFLDLWHSLPIMICILVGMTGLEPVQCYHRGILSPLCLPIPPHPHIFFC